VIVCVGLATLDTIAAVPGLPEPDGRVVATDHAVAGGGPAATAAVALARRGVEVAFVGRVGDDDAGAAIGHGLADEGVDVSELAVVRGRSPQSSILVSGASRAIAWFRGMLPPLELSPRARELCLDAEWVHADHVGYAAAGALRGSVRVSVDGGVTIPGLDVGGLALYAPTEDELHAAFGGPRRALAAGAELVVVTRGADGSAAYTPDGDVVDAPGIRVEVVSTLGAGDVFHGALLAELARDVPLAEALRAANEVAALSCRALDGRSAIPRTVPA
jgi:sugar/nucleoside kinase (ribokinase family)